MEIKENAGQANVLLIHVSQYYVRRKGSEIMLQREEYTDRLKEHVNLRVNQDIFNTRPMVFIKQRKRLKQMQTNPLKQLLYMAYHQRSRFNQRAF